jgi:hypothetical protein
VACRSKHTPAGIVSSNRLPKTNKNRNRHELTLLKSMKVQNLQQQPQPWAATVVCVRTQLLLRLHVDAAGIHGINNRSFHVLLAIITICSELTCSTGGIKRPGVSVARQRSYWGGGLCCFALVCGCAGEQK